MSASKFRPSDEVGDPTEQDKRESCLKARSIDEIREINRTTPQLTCAITCIDQPVQASLIMSSATEKYQRNLAVMLHSISPEASALHEMRARREQPSLGPSSGTCPHCGILSTPTHGTYRSRNAGPRGLRTWTFSMPHPCLPKEMVWDCNACHKTAHILSQPSKARMPSFPSVYRMSKCSTATQSISIDTTSNGEPVQPHRAKQSPAITVSNSPAASLQGTEALNQAHSRAQRSESVQ